MTNTIQNSKIVSTTKTYEVIKNKGRHGWEAISEYILAEVPDGIRILQLRTSKHGHIIDATARVFIRKVEHGFVSDTTEIFGDFCKAGIAPIANKRATQKAILEVHQLALVEMDNLIQQAKTYYIEKKTEEGQIFSDK